MKRFMLLLALQLLLLTAGFSQQITKTLLFIGSYTEGKPDTGIYVYEFNSTSGELKKLSEVENITNPSFISISPNGKYLYACTDTKLPKEGSVTAFKINNTTGKLILLNKQLSGGENPAYLSVHKNSKHVVVGNYDGGSVSAFTTNEDGSLNPLSQLIQFTDSSIIKKRQEKSHVHATVFSPDNEFIFLPDLGADKIRAFKFDTTKLQPLVATNNETVNSVPGSGPRHFIFHPNNKFAYCIEELSGTVAVYSYKSGKLDSIQKTFSYSKKQETYGSADIHISPDGQFLYASNRWDNENTIAIFKLDQVSGKLKLAGHQSTYGDHPRNFVIDPSGNFLLVANQASNTIVVFRRDKISGFLSKIEAELKINSPSCLKTRNYYND